MSITITLTDEELSEIATTLEKLAKAIELVNGKPAGIGKYFDQAGERLNRALEKLKAEMEHEQTTTTTSQNRKHRCEISTKGRD